MTFGTAGIVMTQVEATQRYACWPGLTGQVGWAGGLHWTPTEIGMCVVSVICCGAWLWGMWRYWLAGLISTDATPTAAPGISRALRKEVGGKWSKPKLTLVRDKKT